MKRASLAAFVLMVLLAAAACARGGATINVELPDTDRQIALSQGDSLVVTLPADIRTGYDWTYFISDDRILHYGGYEYIGKVGASGMETWTFKAAEKGTCTLTMEYDLGEGDVPPIQKFILTVIVD